MKTTLAMHNTECTTVTDAEKELSAGFLQQSSISNSHENYILELATTYPYELPEIDVKVHNYKKTFTSNDYRKLHQKYITAKHQYSKLF